MKVTCYGAGVIGASWATAFVLGGHCVTVYDLQAEFLTKARDQIRQNLVYLSENDCLDAARIDALLTKVRFTTAVDEAIHEAEFIQESGPERLNIKQQIVALIDQSAPADCVVASSTSGLRISEITAQSTHPERYIGAHPFNPPHLIPLVEITRSEQTSQQTVDRAVQFYRELKKEPIVLQKEKVGFVANRLSHAVLREVMSLVAEGVCTPEEADKALVYGPGLRWASIGQNVIGELGSQGGNREAAVRFKPLNEMIFRDLENRTELPENWGEIAAEGALRAVAQMPPATGHTLEGAARFRDKVLIELLKLHEKF